MCVSSQYVKFAGVAGKNEIIGELQTFYTVFRDYHLSLAILFFPETVGPSPKKARVEPQFHTEVKAENSMISVYMYMCTCAHTSLEHLYTCHLL